ncbi:MAG: B12-binding domain-containing radical SAM protein [Nitrospinae bacterium]|nr:B12-binding domain-containing radical SAM protein [Nitrospinota bacterium]
MKILLVVYDNDSYVSEFPISLAYISAILMREGHEVDIYNQDIHHYKDEELTRVLDETKYDVVGVSVIAGYYQYRKLLKLSDAINRSKNRPIFIIGGHGPSPEPDFFLKKTQADIIVIGEGEDTTVELFKALSDKSGLAGIAGIAHRDGDKVVTNTRRALIKDIDTIPFPAYHKFPIEHYRMTRMPHILKSEFALPILSGRGCTFTCNFCYRMDKGFRPRKVEYIVEEMRLLKKDYGITYFAFYDELLMSSVERTEEIAEGFIKAGLNVKWNCNGRLNYARPELLKLMKKSGCVFINYGIEAMDDQILKNMKKGLTVKQVISGIEATLAAGISPGYNIIFGNIGEGRETLQKGVDFLLKYDDGAQMRTIRPVTPYPGSPLYYHAIKEGLLKDVEDFYENKHTNSDLLAVNFTNMTDDEFYAAMTEANMALTKNYYDKMSANVLNQVKHLYSSRDATFRGFRQT